MNEDYSSNFFNTMFNLTFDDDKNSIKIKNILDIYFAIFLKKYETYIITNINNEYININPNTNILKIDIDISGIPINIDTIKEKLINEYDNVSYINFLKYKQYYIADIILKIKNQNGLSDKGLEEHLKNLLSTESIAGGNSNIHKINKKEILGKERCIYKKPGDRKEYLKHKGELITVKDYKKLMKDKK